jgi:hypothetical protein
MFVSLLPSPSPRIVMFCGNMDMDRVMWRLMGRVHVRVVEAEMASLRGNEKSMESVECRNKG